jgi:hypothetical protein
MIKAAQTLLRGLVELLSRCRPFEFVKRQNDFHLDEK